MTPPPDYELEGRLISAADAEWIARFAAGEEWWSHEITQFLREHALEHSTHGINQTMLFSFPDYREIVGFVTANYHSLPVGIFPTQTFVSVSLPAQRIPAALIPFLGVARSYRRLGFGEEIHAQLLESISISWTAARWVYCECWVDNEGGMAFWLSRGYEELRRRLHDRPDGNGKAWLASLVMDRFALGPLPNAGELPGG